MINWRHASFEPANKLSLKRLYIRLIMVSTVHTILAGKRPTARVSAKSALTFTYLNYNGEPANFDLDIDISSTEPAECLRNCKHGIWSDRELLPAVCFAVLLESVSHEISHDSKVLQIASRGCSSSTVASGKRQLCSSPALLRHHRTGRSFIGAGWCGKP